jgi:hypothetical protein
MKNLIIIASFAFVCGCLPKPDKMIPFPFNFPAESDGCYSIHVRKLSIRQTDAIYVNLNLESCDYLRKFYAGTAGALVFNLSPTQTIKQCWIDELSGKPEEFRWNHFELSEKPKDRWIATAGTITVHTYRRPKEENYLGFITSILISNVVFQSSNTKQRTRLDSLSFTNVHVGWTPQ